MAGARSLIRRSRNGFFGAEDLYRRRCPNAPCGIALPRRFARISSTGRCESSQDRATPREAPQTRDDPLTWWRRLSHDSFRMVGTRILPKLGNGDENPAANAPCWQPPRRDQIVQGSLANREHLSRFLAARQDFAFHRHGNSRGRLLSHRLLISYRMLLSLSRLHVVATHRRVGEFACTCDQLQLCPVLNACPRPFTYSAIPRRHRRGISGHSEASSRI